MIRRLILLSCFIPAGCAGVAPLPAMPGGPATVVAPATAAARDHAMAEFAIPRAGRPNAVPYQIVSGADGAMWFTEEGAGAVGRIDRLGRIRQFPLPSRNAQPEGLALGSDGALYVAENAGPSEYATHVARVTTGGSVREWNDSDFMPQGVAPGPGGSLWFTQSCGGLAVLSPSQSTVRQYPLQGIPSQTNAIVEGGDGAMWFAEDGSASIGRIARSGALALYRGLLFEGTYADLPHGVVKGDDGNLWWTALESGAIWATNGRGEIVHVYTIPTAGSQPWGIALGPDGALWFTEYGTGKIGRVTTSGAFTEFAIPTPNAKPQGLAFGPDGKLWFVESGVNQIGRIDP